MKKFTQPRIFAVLLSLIFLTSSVASAQTESASGEKTKMLYRRGLAAYKAKDFSSAENFFEQALEVSYSPDAAVYLTYIRKETGDFQGALKSLQSYLDNTGENDPELQSYISLKLFLEARLADQVTESKLATSRTIAFASIVIAVIALAVSVLALKKKG
jgi:tetratricopeptide (TPR) repeat protein